MTFLTLEQIKKELHMINNIILIDTTVYSPFEYSEYIQRISALLGNISELRMSSSFHYKKNKNEEYAYALNEGVKETSDSLHYRISSLQTAAKLLSEEKQNSKYQK